MHFLAAAIIAGALQVLALFMAFVAGYGLADPHSDNSRAVVVVFALALLLAAGSGAALLVSGAH